MNPLYQIVLVLVLILAGFAGWQRGRVYGAVFAVLGVALVIAVILIVVHLLGGVALAVFFVTPPLVIVDLPADHNHYGGARIYPPQFIYLHATGGVDSRDWLTKTSPPAHPVSSHRLIRAGVLYKLVADQYNAWTEGYGHMGGHPGNLNEDGLSIEIENMDTGHDPYLTGDVRLTAMQCIEWWGAYGFLPIIAHATVDAAKVDPAGFPWQDFYHEVDRQLASVLSTGRWA